jgi:hypothetical protein
MSRARSVRSPSFERSGGEDVVELGSNPTKRRTLLAKPNYQFEKRQKELAKKRKQEEKQKRKAAKNESPPAEGGSSPSDANKE